MSNFRQRIDSLEGDIAELELNMTTTLERAAAANFNGTWFEEQIESIKEAINDLRNADTDLMVNCTTAALHKYLFSIFYF